MAICSSDGSAIASGKVNRTTNIVTIESILTAPYLSDVALGAICVLTCRARKDVPDQTPWIYFKMFHLLRLGWKRRVGKLIAINADSGSEFMNKEMLKFTNYGDRIEFTRSRPYKKNDNCYVEQKNFTHVRELFGYERFEDPQLLDLMNDIYGNYWNPLQNYFLPTYKLKEKIRVGGMIRKKYDRPETPFTRLISSPHLSETQKKKLREQKEKLDPFQLKKTLELKLKDFFDLVRKVDIKKTS
jgi:hypothetical protein